MGDLRRIVHFSPGGRPVLDLDLEVSESYYAERDSFDITPGPRQVRTSQSSRRYQGSRPVGESHENGTIAGKWHVKGPTADEAIGRARALIAQVERVARGRFFEWRPRYASQPGYWELRGAGTWKPTYRAVQFEQVPFWEFDVAFPVAPVARAAPMDISDDFEVDTTTDYISD